MVGHSGLQRDEADEDNDCHTRTHQLRNFATHPLSHPMLSGPMGKTIVAQHNVAVYDYKYRDKMFQEQLCCLI